MADNTISPSLKSHFLNLYGMMIADMEVSPLEKAEIYRIGREEFGLTVEELDKLIISNEILFYLPEKDEDKIIYLYDMASLAWADGKITDEEKGLLRQTAMKFGFEEDKVDEVSDLMLEKAKQKLTHSQVIKEFFE